VALVKPQFEVGRNAVGKRGVVRDEQARSNAIARVVAESEAIGFLCNGQADAVLAGPEGNREHFIWLRKP
jgi:23S rRNA (cytidine1920-2'-O)/16S rRNA (cytidine1409-2'-O)-methyltransferase